MKHSKLFTGVAVAALSMGAALAGSKFTGNGAVTVTLNADGSGTARAYLGMVYNGPAMREYLGCQQYASGGAFCHALTDTGTRGVCSTQSAFLGAAVGSISPDARVIFSWNASGVCTSIQVTHSSEFADKQGL